MTEKIDIIEVEWDEERYQKNLEEHDWTGRAEYLKEEEGDNADR